jgi:hypothetical protein
MGGDEEAMAGEGSGAEGEGEESAVGYEGAKIEIEGGTRSYGRFRIVKKLTRKRHAQQELSAQPSFPEYTDLAA